MSAFSKFFKNIGKGIGKVAKVALPVATMLNPNLKAASSLLGPLLNKGTSQRDKAIDLIARNSTSGGIANSMVPEFKQSEDQTPNLKAVAAFAPAASDMVKSSQRQNAPAMKGTQLSNISLDPGLQSTIGAVFGSTPGMQGVGHIVADSGAVNNSLDFIGNATDVFSGMMNKGGSKESSKSQGSSFNPMSILALLAQLYSGYKDSKQIDEMYSRVMGNAANKTSPFTAKVDNDAAIAEYLNGLKTLDKELI